MNPTNCLLRSEAFDRVLNVAERFYSEDGDDTYATLNSAGGVISLIAGLPHDVLVRASARTDDEATFSVSAPFSAIVGALRRGGDHERLANLTTAPEEWPVPPVDGWHERGALSDGLYDHLVEEVRNAIGEATRLVRAAAAGLDVDDKLRHIFDGAFGDAVDTALGVPAGALPVSTDPAEGVLIIPANVIFNSSFAGLAGDRRILTNGSWFCLRTDDVELFAITSSPSWVIHLDPDEI